MVTVACSFASSNAMPATRAVCAGMHTHMWWNWDGAAKHTMLIGRNAVQAYAAARMAESCLLGLQGKDNIYECAYVESSIIPELDYFASKVLQLFAEERMLFVQCRFKSLLRQSGHVSEALGS